jgi:beta-phosphoglucomutase-like phosphatase (HAD superfamily)
MSIAPSRCAAVEDSENGIRSAHAAKMRVIAIPNPHFPPAEDALALAAVTLPDLDALTPDVL